jgi:hypothetical protein
MSVPGDAAFNERVHETLLPVVERYVAESGHPDQVSVADFDPNEPLLDYTQTHLQAAPLRPRLIEPAGKLLTAKLMGIPPKVLDKISAAFDPNASDIVGSRQERPLVHLADHTPNLLPVATQFAGNLALARSITTGSYEGRLEALIRRSHGIGTVGYRPFKIRPIPIGPGLLIGRLARTFTNTHYSIPPTAQYRELDWQDGDVDRINTALVTNLVEAIQDPREADDIEGGLNPLSLKPEIVINPPGTKQLEEGGKVILPKASGGTGILIDAVRADVLEVYTAFEFDDDGKISDVHCEVGEVLEVPEGEGRQVVKGYMQRLADFRSEHEGREVVYAGVS